jgi:nitrite transporter NirC
MPISIAHALTDHEALAASKATQATRTPARYFVASLLAGVYVGVAVLLLVMTTAGLVAAKSPATKLVQGGVFGVALTLVVFAGAELFTGNVMVMLQGVMAGRAKVGGLAAVCMGSLLGNLGGSLGFAALVNASGVLNSGATPGQPSAFKGALTGIVAGKAALTGGQLFWRAVLCNMLVCLALWMAARAKTDAAKLVVLWWALLAFIASGFEHSIANMTVFGLAVFGHVPGADWGELWRNLLYTVPGNVVGGGLLVGAAYGYIGASAGAPAAPSAQVGEPVVAPSNGNGRARPLAAR